jgi:hypothetical protein
VATETTAIQKATQPALINIGPRTLSVRGFRHDALAEHLALNKEWSDIGTLARIFLGRNTESNRSGIRNRLPRAFRWFLDKNCFLLIEYAQHGNGFHGKALAVKLYQGQQGLEREHAGEQLERMRRRKEINTQKFERAQQLLLLFEPPTTGLGPSLLSA